MQRIVRVRFDKIVHCDGTAPAQNRRRKKYCLRHQENDFHHYGASVTQQQVKHQQQVDIDNQETFGNESHPRFNTIHAVNLKFVETDNADRKKYVKTQRDKPRFVCLFGILVDRKFFCVVGSTFERIAATDQQEKPSQVQKHCDAKIVSETNQHVLKKSCRLSDTERKCRCFQFRSRCRQAAKCRSCKERDEHYRNKFLQSMNAERKLIFGRRVRPISPQDIRQVRSKENPQSAHEI